MREEAAVALCDHSASFVAVLEQGNVFATQFSSGEVGPAGAQVLQTSCGAPGKNNEPRAPHIPCLDTDGERVVKACSSSICAMPEIRPRSRHGYNIEGADELVVLGHCRIARPPAHVSRKIRRVAPSWPFR